MTNPWPYGTSTPGLLTGFEGLAYPQFVPPPATYTQYSTDLLDYGIDWSDFLPTGDAIVTSTWAADPGIDIGQFAHTETSTTVWVSGGTPAHSYRVFNTVTTEGGRDTTRMLTFKIKTTVWDDDED